MIRKIDHVGIAVRSLEQRLGFWAEALGLEVSEIETVESEQVKAAFLEIGESRIELLEPTSEDSTVGKFLSKRGEGIHHITLAVEDIERSLATLGERGVNPIGKAPRDGAGGHRVAFLHPSAAGGVLIELVERAAKEPRVDPWTLDNGSAILLYLHEPQEKLWGILRRLDTAGVVLQGIDLASFDDWVSQIERDEESVVGPSTMFLPMARVEKILLDRSSGHLASLAERFERRTGRTVFEVLD